ncbi:MAG: hypothetical protein MUC54_06650 [Chloroflexi bacterium]|nr:hypothetical protein [Chloroflexota bacterium]
MVIVTLFGLLALFSFVSIVLSGEEDDQVPVDPRDLLPLWARFATR